MYGYDNYQKVKLEIETRRQRAIAEAEARAVRLREENEDVREIDRELMSTGLRLFKAACSGTDITPIKERNQLLTAARAKILKELGLPEDYTLPHYTCKICSDTGYCNDRMCSCMQQMILKENIKSSGIGNLIEKQSFDNFDLGRYNDEKTRLRMERNLREAKDYAENFASAERNLLLIGKTGTGKTHVSTAIAKYLIEAGYEVIYDSAENIMQAFVADKFPDRNKPFVSKSEKYMDADLLIIDDLGTEFINQLTVSSLYNLLNTRMNKGLKTVISTNLSPEELSTKYDDRLYSRIIGSTTNILLFVGEDARLSS